MESGPSDYVCLECSLRFKNAGTFEKHKRKFCQGRGRHDNTWSQTANGDRGIANSQQDFPLKSASSGEFWSKKTNAERMVLHSPSKQQVKEFEKITHSGTYGNLNQIGAGMKFNSVLEDLRFEQEKLEEHKKAIQEKLAKMHGETSLRENQQVLANGQRRQHILQMEKSERNHAMEAHLEDLESSLLKFQQPPSQNGRRKEYLYASTPGYDNGHMILAHLKKLKRQYIEDGGDDTRIFEMFHRIEKQVYKNGRSPSRSGRDSETVKQLQQQLLMFQQTNESLMKELEILKASRDRHREPLKSQISEQETLRKDFSTFHEKKLMEMKQEAEIYRQQLELERLKNELQQMRGGIPSFPQLPAIQYHQQQQQQQQPQQQQPQQNHPLLHQENNMVMSERDTYQMSNEKTDEAFQPSPYDPGGGFAIFWDFICGITQAAEQCRIAVTMFKDGVPVSDSKVLPPVPCNTTNENAIVTARYSGRMAVLGIKQVFPRCLPLQSLNVIVKVQMGSQRDLVFEKMQEVGWSQVDIFDSFSRVIAGRWKVPIRVPPVEPTLTAAQLNAVQQICQENFGLRCSDCSKLSNQVRRVFYWLISIHVWVPLSDVLYSELDGCELLYRLINVRDIESQEGVILTSQQTKSYKYPPMEHKVAPMPNITLESRRPVISRADTPEERRRSSKRKSKTPIRSPEVILPQSVASPQPKSEPSRIEPTPQPIIPSPVAAPVRYETPKLQTPAPEPTPQPEMLEVPSEAVVKGQYFVGFQIDKIYDVNEATVRLQITIYGGNGKVVVIQNSPASKRSFYCRTPFLKSVISFALEEIQFADLPLDFKSFAIIEVYTTASGGYLSVKQTEEEEEELVCWTLIKLARVYSDIDEPSRNSRRSRISRLDDEDDTDELLKVNSGPKKIALYAPPVLEPRQVLASFKNPQIVDRWERLGPAYITVFVFDKKILPPALPQDIPLISSEEAFPENAWVAGERTSPPTKVYKNGDGFELYVDAGRFFPDNCAYVKVLCQLYDSKYTKLKDEFESDINLDLSPHDPQFDLKFEYREFSYPPTAVILIKVFIIDAITRQAFRLGVSLLPIFVKTGTFDRSDDLDSKFCLNEGCFQLRLYNELKNAERLIRNSIERPVACASLLVRLLPAPCYPDGQPKQATEFLEDQWESEGLLIKKPAYTEGKYETKDCKPTVVECRMLNSYVKRKPQTTREVMKTITEGRKSKNDQGLVDTIKNLLKNIHSVPSADLMHLAKYSSMHGVAISIDSAQNLPWGGFTFATYCFSPPASFYKGKLDDPAVLVTKLDLDGCIRLPKWNDGIKVFPRRRSHSNLVVIVHLYEVVLAQKGGGGVEFTFGAQAWTVIPVCYQDYTYNGLFQVGIFHDAPTTAIIDQMQNEPLAETITTMRKRKVLKLVDGSSIFVRLGDARRREELNDPTKLTVRKTFLPRGNKYLNPVQSKRFATLIPPDQNAEEYGKVLATKFRILAGQSFQFRIPK